MKRYIITGEPNVKNERYIKYSLTRVFRTPIYSAALLQTPKTDRSILFLRKFIGLKSTLQYSEI